MQVLAQTVGELHVGGKVSAVDGLVHEASRHRARCIVGEDRALALGNRRDGEEQIARGLDRRVHERVDSDAELERPDKRVVPTLRLHRAVGNRVVAHVEAHANGIRLVGFQALEHQVDLRVENHVAVCRILIKTDHLLEYLVRDALLVPEAKFVVTGVGTGHQLAARAVEVAGNRLQSDDALAVLHTVGLLVDSKAPHDRCGLRLRVHARCRVNLLDGNLTNLCGLLRRHGRNTLSQLVEAIAPVLDEVMIIEILFDDDVEHCHRQGGVRASAQLEVDISASGKPIDARVDLDETRSSTHRIDDSVAEEAVRVRLEGSLAPHDDDLGQLIALVVPTTRQSAGIVPLGIRRARDIGRSRKAGSIARVARLHVAVVRGSEHHRRVQRHRATLATGAGHADDRLGTVLLADALVVLLDDRERLVPRALDPRVFLAAISAVALHRLDDAGGAVHVILERDAPRAKTALGDRMVLVALDVNELAVLVNVEFKAAANRMASRRRPGAGTGDGHVVVFVTPRLSNVVHVGKTIQLHDGSCFVIA